MKRKRVLLGLLAATVVVAGGAWFWYRERSRSVSPEILRTAAVTIETIPLTIVSSGNVSVQRQFTAAFSTSGTVESVDVETGDRVGRGDRLAASTATQQRLRCAKLKSSRLRRPS